MRLRTVVKITVVVVVAVLVAAVAALRSIDFDRHRGLIAERVEAATGRKLVIAGRLELRLISLAPALTVADVTFANAAWGSRPEMVRLKRLEAEIALLPLLIGTVEFRRLVLVAPEILLETDAQGRGNWLFETGAPGPAGSGAPEGGDGEQGAPALPAVSEVRIEDATLTYRDGRTGETTTLVIERLSGWAESANSPLSLKAEGSYNGARFSASAVLGALSGFDDSGAPFPVAVTAEAGGATVKVTGTVRGPRQGSGVDVNLSLAGEDLAALGAFAGIGLPAAGPYGLAARIAERDGAIEITGLEARVGKSDLTGTAKVIRGERPNVQARLASTLIDLDDLAGPAPGEGGPEEGGPKEGGKAGGRLFSDAPLGLEGLAAADGEVTLTAQRIAGRGPTLENVTVTATLKDGRLDVKPVTAEVADGRLEAEAVVEVGGGAPRVAATVKVTALDLAVAASEMGIEETLSGRGSLDVGVGGRGGSVRAIMAGLNGSAGLALGESRLDNAYMKVLLADLSKAVLGKGDAAKVNCLVGRFEITDGRAVSRALVMDTEGVTITGAGYIDLGAEELDLLLTPEPKKVSLANLAVPVRVRGPLAAPTIFPDPAGVAKKAAKAAVGAMTGVGALGLLAPLMGEGAVAGRDDSPCLALPGGEARAGEREAAPAANKGPEDVLIEGVGDGLESIGKGIKGLFE